jgi:hypothetical protein
MVTRPHQLPGDAKSPGAGAPPDRRAPGRYLAKLLGPATVTVDPDEVTDAAWFEFDAVPAASGPPGTFGRDRRRPGVLAETRRARPSTPPTGVTGG